jgi:hypothetical protein
MICMHQHGLLWVLRAQTCFSPTTSASCWHMHACLCAKDNRIQHRHISYGTVPVRILCLVGRDALRCCCLLSKLMPPHAYSVRALCPNIQLTGYATWCTAQGQGHSKNKTRQATTRHVWHAARRRSLRQLDQVRCFGARLENFISVVYSCTKLICSYGLI